MKTVFFAIVLCLIQLAEVLGGDKVQTLSGVRQRGVRVTQILFRPIIDCYRITRIRSIL